MKKSPLHTLFAVIVFLQVSMVNGFAVAAVPAPPVIQMQGIADTVFNNQQEHDCKHCHNQNPPAGIPVDPTYLADRHHLNVGTTIPPISVVPYSDPDGDGVPNITYECLSCHTLTWDPNTFTYVLVPDYRDCMSCHDQTPHHGTLQACSQDCMACHGGLINNPGDGHTIPSYQPSLVTPWPSGKPNEDITIVSSAGTSPGNCNFCHNTADGQRGNPRTSLEMTWIQTIAPIYQNMETHHAIDLPTHCSTNPPLCNWCHDVSAPTGYAIRQCETCHGISTLHNIAADSDGDGNGMPGQEPAGYSHTGAPSDCWGCHGNNTALSASAPFTGPVIPGLHSIDHSSIVAGIDNTLTLAGMNFTNYVQNPWTGNYDIYLSSVIRLTDRLNNAMDLEPTTITEGSLKVVIPSIVSPGNYQIAVAKGPSSSNPMNLSVTPPVIITSAECSRRTSVLTVRGSGFSMYLAASNSGTSVKMNSEIGTVTSWSDSEITAEFSYCKRTATATVQTVFDSATAPVTRVR